MVHIDYENSDIETLMTKGQGRFLVRLPKKRALLKVLKAFMAVLEVISATKDLLYYKWLNYTVGKEMSFVQLMYGEHSCTLLFSEQEAGRKIMIKDFKI